MTVFRKEISSPFLVTRLATIALVVLLSACGGSDGETEEELPAYSAEYSADAFITTWKTNKVGKTKDDQIRIKTLGSGYSYNVDWGDGSFDENLERSITHTYPTEGTYTVSITGTFPRIYLGFVNDDDYDNDEIPTAADHNKLMTIEQWGSTSLESLDSAFSRCENLISNAIDYPDLSGVTNMNNMFRGARKFNQNLNSWDVSSVTEMDGMFYGASSFNGDISSWDVSSVIDIEGMFADASSFNQDISSWDISSLRDINSLFIRATSFNQDLSSWDVSNVVDMESLFKGANSFNQDISSWDVSSVILMSDMFEGASSFDQDLSAWNISSVRYMYDMFKDVSLSIANYDALLIGWSVQSLNSDVTFSAGDSQYSNASQSARDTLTNAFNWTLTDGGLKN